MNSKFMKNVLFGFGGQFIILVLGIIIPRIMIVSYGSDINGLISTVTQIFTYMALMEAGIGQSARNALYKEIANKNKEGVSYIASIAQRYFRKITLYYGLGVIILSFITPLIIKSDIDNLTIILIVLLEGISGVISFYYIQTPSIILSADGKHYVNNGVFVINKTIGYIVKIMMAIFGVDIVVLQFFYFLITIGKVVFYKKYFKQHYSWINYELAPRNAKLKDRNAFVLTEFAWTIFSSTDVIVLSTFVSTQMSSVYSVYNFVFTNLNVLLNSVYNSVVYVLGQTFYEDRKKYIVFHDAFTSFFLGGITILMCVAYILVIPFIRLYTKGVTDIQYIYTSLPVLFGAIQILSWSRFITGNLTGVAGYAKQVSIISCIEASVNLILSIVLVQKYGIEGVLFATILALPIKIVYCVYICDKKILRRSILNSIKILGVNYAFFILTINVEKIINININSYFDLFICGVIVTVICTIIGVLLNIIVNPMCITLIKTIYFNKIKK